MGNDNLGELYRETILDHYKDPRGKKKLDSIDAEQVGHNPLCGDKVTVSVKYHENEIEDISVVSEGCAISIASGSIMAEMLQDKNLQEVEQILEIFYNMMYGKEYSEEVDIGELDVLEGVKRYPIRIKCALLPWAAIKELLKTWNSKNTG